MGPIDENTPASQTPETLQQEYRDAFANLWGSLPNIDELPEINRPLIEECLSAKYRLDAVSHPPENWFGVDVREFAGSIMKLMEADAIISAKNLEETCRINRLARAILPGAKAWSMCETPFLTLYIDPLQIQEDTVPQRLIARAVEVMDFFNDELLFGENAPQSYQRMLDSLWGSEDSTNGQLPRVTTRLITRCIELCLEERLRQPKPDWCGALLEALKFLRNESDCPDALIAVVENMRAKARQRAEQLSTLICPDEKRKKWPRSTQLQHYANSVKNALRVREREVIRFVAKKVNEPDLWKSV